MTLYTSVNKFGGDAGKDVDQIIRTVSTVFWYRQGKQFVSVVSAMKGVTDQLLGIIKAVESGNDELAKYLGWQIREKHLGAAHQLGLNGTMDKELELMSQLIDPLPRNVILNPRTSDSIAFFGERLSTLLYVAAMQATGIPAIAVDSCSLLLAAEQYGKRQVLIDESRENVQRILHPMLERGLFPVITGFAAQDIQSGQPMTLDRGGSDYVAACTAVCLEGKHYEDDEENVCCEELALWKQDPGVRKRDPKIDPNAEIIPYLSHEESVGVGKVLHNSTAIPLKESNIPLIVKGLTNPNHPGTVICSLEMYNLRYKER